MATLICVRIVYGCFLALRTELSVHNRDRMFHKAPNIYYLALCRKSSPASAVSPTGFEVGCYLSKNDSWSQNELKERERRSPREGSAWHHKTRLTHCPSLSLCISSPSEHLPFHSQGRISTGMRLSPSL